MTQAILCTVRTVISGGRAVPRMTVMPSRYVSTGAFVRAMEKRFVLTEAEIERKDRRLGSNQTAEHRQDAEDWLEVQDRPAAVNRGYLL